MEIREFWSRIGYYLPETVQFDKKTSELGQEFLVQGKGIKGYPKNIQSTPPPPPPGQEKTNSVKDSFAQIGKQEKN